MDLSPRRLPKADENVRDRDLIAFEIFVEPGFTDLELTSVVSILTEANDVAGRPLFCWRMVSNVPGKVQGRCGTFVHAQPALANDMGSNWYIVVGSANSGAGAWLNHVHALRAHGKSIALLGEAVAAYVELGKAFSGQYSTHWQDAVRLKESGHFPNLRTTLASSDAGFVTSPGAGFTTELMIHIVAAYMTNQEVAEISSRFMISTVRDGREEQPRALGNLSKSLPLPVAKAIAAMENNVAEPLDTKKLSEYAGVSIRQLERLFRRSLNISPTRFYKSVRIRAAHPLVVDTTIPFVDVSVYAGFGSKAAFSKAYKSEFGSSPMAMRSSYSLGI